jgi:FkbM family methyltransferase
MKEDRMDNAPPLLKKVMDTLETVLLEARGMATVNIARAIFNLERHKELQFTRDHLSDEESKETFDKIVCVHAAVPFLGGAAWDRFGPVSKAQWQEATAKASLLESSQVIKDDSRFEIAETWINEAYRYKDQVSAKEGDIIIDAGAYTGNTALYFSRLAGKNGKVIALEPSPIIFTKLSDHLKQFPECTNVIPIREGISKEKGTMNFVQNSGHMAASRISEKGEIKVKINTIDCLVKEQNLSKLDFLKMDVEGAEVDGLEGSRETIQKFHPKLAICLYHKPADLFEVMEKILSISSHYDFYIKSATGGVAGTILLCSPSHSENKKN